ncbi:MAG: hypothetical protein ACLTZM_08765 [Ruminococcus sp.]
MGQLLAELDDKLGIGLITRVRQGQESRTRYSSTNAYCQKCQKDISRSVKTTCLEM